MSECLRLTRVRNRNLAAGAAASSREHADRKEARMKRSAYVLALALALAALLAAVVPSAAAPRPDAREAGVTLTIWDYFINRRLYAPVAMGAVTYKGKVWGLPIARETTLLSTTRRSCPSRRRRGTS
jgi:hypothetical protein